MPAPRLRASAALFLLQLASAPRVPSSPPPPPQAASQAPPPPPPAFSLSPTDAARKWRDSPFARRLQELALADGGAADGGKAGGGANRSVRLSYLIGASVPTRSEAATALLEQLENATASLQLVNISRTLARFRGVEFPACVEDPLPPSLPLPPAEPPAVPAIPAPPPQETAVLSEGQSASCNPGLENVGGSCIPCRSGHWCRGGVAIRCEPGTYNDLPSAIDKANCTACPLDGTDCSSGDSFVVLRGYFLAATPKEPAGRAAYKCAQPDACVGGNGTGDANCAAGSYGALCGQCSSGYYRGKRGCLVCPERVEARERGLWPRLARLWSAGFWGNSSWTAGAMGQNGSWVEGHWQNASWVNGSWRNVTLCDGGNGTEVECSQGTLKGSDGQEAAAGLGANVLSALMMAGVALGAALLFYLYLRQPAVGSLLPGWLSGVVTELLRGQTIARMATNLPRQAAIISTLFKVVISYCQCIGAVRGFTKIQWPLNFELFMEVLDYFNPELFEVVPAECIADTRLGFYMELLAVLCLPLLGIGLVLLLARLAAIGRPRSAYSGTLGSVYGNARVYKISSWLLLFMYPSIARKTLQTFDCLPYGEISLLRADPAEECGTMRWFVWASLAGLGAVVYCLGLPLAAWWASRRWGASQSRELRERVSLLVGSYRPECWYMESVDLLRKFLLTGVVLVILPETRAQLWFGIVTTLLTFVMYMRLLPYAEQVCGRVQSAALLQILFTYVTAILFFEDGGEHYGSGHNTLGVMLVLANSMCFMVLAVYVMWGVTSSAKKVGELRLVFADDKTAVKLGPPTTSIAMRAKAGLGNATPNNEKKQRRWSLSRSPKDAQARASEKEVGPAFHCFLSHQWAAAQDLAGATKSLLRTMVPSCRVFLDVDDLEDVSKLEEYISATDVIVIFVTTGYITSYNCRREFMEALRLRKPMVLVRETDPAHGGITETGLKAEFELLTVRGQLEENEEAAIEALIKMLPQSVEWHREKAFKHTVLKEILRRVYMQQPHMKGVKECPPMVMRDELKLPDGLAGSVVALSELYRDVLASNEQHDSMYEEIEARLMEVGIRVADVENVPTVVLLSPEVFRSQPLINEICLTLAPKKPTLLQRGMTMTGLVARQNTGTGLIMGSAGRDLMQDIDRRGSLAHRNSHGNAQPRPLVQILPLASTLAPFDHYIRDCPPELRNKGLFKLFFEKWPESALLQRMATLQLAHKLPRTTRNRWRFLPCLGQTVVLPKPREKSLPAAQRAKQRRLSVDGIQRDPSARKPSLASASAALGGSTYFDAKSIALAEASGASRAPAKAGGSGRIQFGADVGGQKASATAKGAGGARTPPSWASGGQGATARFSEANLRTSTYDKGVESLSVVTWSKLDLTAVLGSGATGRVYRATYHNKTVAARRLSRHVCSLYSSDQLKHEVDQVAALRHTHLMRVAALVIEPGEPFGVLSEFAPRSLTQALLEHTETSMLEVDAIRAVSIAKQVAQGLAFLHGKSVLHGSLWPCNVMLCVERTSGEMRHVKLSDYGRGGRILMDVLEEAMGEDRGAKGEAADADATDRLPYVSPEHIQGEAMGPRADIYALGALLSRMGTVAPLFSSRATNGSTAPAACRPPWSATLEALVSRQLSPTDGLAAAQPPAPSPYLALAQRCVELEAYKRPTASACIKSMTHLAVGLAVSALDGPGGASPAGGASRIAAQKLPAPSALSYAGESPERKTLRQKDAAQSSARRSSLRPERRTGEGRPAAESRTAAERRTGVGERRGTGVGRRESTQPAGGQRAAGGRKPFARRQDLSHDEIQQAPIIFERMRRLTGEGGTTAMSSSEARAMQVRRQTVRI